MIRQKTALGLALSTFGAGLLLAAALPLGVLLFLFAALLIAAGVFLTRC
ncbi:MAG: hypothetical protein LBT60_02520 [Oscillospiraceae bacterium]|jgi:hypothetical protein|nr:hypothetical protein [Oscillospiraceae bacterium]